MQFPISLLIALSAVASITSSQKTPAEALTVDPCRESPNTLTLATCQNQLSKESTPNCPSDSTAVCRFAPIDVMDRVSQRCKDFITARGGETYYYMCATSKVTVPKPLTDDPCPESPYRVSMSSCQTYVANGPLPNCPYRTQVVCRFAPTGLMQSVSQSCNDYVKTSLTPYYYFCQDKSSL